VERQRRLGSRRAVHPIDLPLRRPHRTDRCRGPGRLLRRPRFSAVEALACGPDQRIGLHELRVDDRRTRLRFTPHRLTDLPAQPVVELGDQSGLAPAAEEGVDPIPGREVHRHRLPLDPVVQDVEDGVEHLAGAVALRTSPRPSIHAGTGSSGLSIERNTASNRHRAAVCQCPATAQTRSRLNARSSRCHNSRSPGYLQLRG
jgi:hypothetical protein